MIAIREPWEIDRIRSAGSIIAGLWHRLKPALAAGTTTAELDRLAESYILGEKGVPAFKGYRGYPATLCVSINHEVVHGIPSDRRRLSDGDLVGVDVGVAFEGYIADAARSFLIGGTPPALALKLSAVARQALDLAVEAARPGNRVADLSRAIQRTAESAGFTVVRQLCGHGVGKSLHEEPEIPNFHKSGLTPALKPGMVLAIEPMVNAGGWQVDFMADGWTVVTSDGSLSAHFEDTVVVTEKDPLAVTRDQ